MLAARNTTSMTVRGTSWSAKAPLRCSRAAWMLAGNMAIISNESPVAAATDVRRYTRPAAPASSSTPVIVTSTPGAGSDGGTISTSSPRIPTKWATPVIANIVASPYRTGTVHGRSLEMPAADNAASPPVTLSRAMSGSMTLSFRSTA